MVYWIIVGIVLVVLIGLYIWVFTYGRKRQREFDEQYSSMKERHDVFVLNKKMTRERAKTGIMKYYPMKTYHVVGRVSVSQSVRGVQMSRMQTVTFHTTKQEYEKIQPNHRYKMDVAGNYIGFVLAPQPVKGKPADKKTSAKGKPEAKKGSTGKKDKSAKASK
ncbi:hypothetical protein LLE49_15495 [Alicyclobacillus tolerans]|uniref:hypothetical protein n=1 Tax=Alicyclobacillus tolerans TaxID=90970 RepID=UPI001F227148|nr:hypothetical protein [Alicyclobacillus tolerans]MCF8566129.1 hypothetical protein [Alicyclobacillus tolerans]